MSTVIPGTALTTDTSARVPVVIATTSRKVSVRIHLHNVSANVESPHSAKKFKDPRDQKAWTAYKRVESRYSNANRKLAE